MFEFIDMIIVRPIVNLLLVIYNLVGDFGLAIIIFTIIVKFAMWPLLKKQLHQTRLMRKIQPELTEIKKNCKGNRQLESLQMMDLYKRNNIKPFRSILTLLIQLPIFIALFTAIRVMVNPSATDSVDVRAYSFVKPMHRISDLIGKQDQFIAEQKTYIEATEKDREKLGVPENSFHPKLFNVVELDKNAGLGSTSSAVILLFAIAAAATQFVMAKQQMPSKKAKKRTFKQIMKEAADGKQTDQSELNTVVSGQMTKIMPIMMLFIMINLPGALVFYYLLTNLVTVVQQKFILSRDLSEMEESTDKKIIKELSDIKEAQVVNKNPKTNITRIKASDKKRRK